MASECLRVRTKLMAMVIFLMIIIMSEQSQQQELL